MFWPVRFAIKLLFRLKLVVVSVLAGMAIAFYLQRRQAQQTWGVVPADVEKPLAGDELIEDPEIIETRSYGEARLRPRSCLCRWSRRRLVQL
jgi:hypothetical protein